MQADAAVDHALARLRAELEPALNTLVPLLHADLRRLAASQRRRFATPPTLNTTAVVNELYLKLVQSEGVNVSGRRHFFALAALVMRQILSDHARRRLASPVDASAALIDVASEDVSLILEVDDALKRLEAVNPRLAQVVTCRWFGGFTEEETAEILGVTDRTVRRDWEKAKAWLGAELGSA